MRTHKKQFSTIGNPRNAAKSVPQASETERPARRWQRRAAMLAALLLVWVLLPGTVFPTAEAAPAWKNNVMMADDPDDFTQVKVFRQDILREEVASITFTDDTAGAPANAWDISEKQDGSVLAWVKGNPGNYDLYIAGDGGVRAPTSCRCLFYGYTAVASIRFNNCFHTDYVTDMHHMFDRCENIQSLDLSGFNTSNANDMQAMFQLCENLTELDLSAFDTSNITDMSYMFYGCGDMEKLDISRFKTGMVTTMREMFDGCVNLKTLDVSGFNSAKVTDMSAMFGYCESLKSLDVSDFNTSKVSDMSGMFYGCKNLTKLEVSGFDTSNVTNMRDMFVSCPGVTAENVRHFDTRNVTAYDNFMDGSDWQWLFSSGAVPDASYGNERVCPTCSGTGACTACGGTGLCVNEECIMGKVTCLGCYGTGDCEACWGLGESLSGTRCFSCGGDGVCTRCDGQEEFTCRFCNGTGDCGKCQGALWCPTCGGSGRA